MGVYSNDEQRTRDWYDAADLGPELRLKVTRASDVVTKPVEWLWDKRIPRGKLTMFDGDPDVGKSVVTMDLAARVSTGRTFPDGAPCEAGNVLIVNVEDAKDDTIVPRLKAHGADLDRIGIIDGIPDDDGGTRMLDLPGDVKTLKVAVEEHEATLLIIDPALTMLSGDVYKDSDARKALTPLRDMAEETGVTVIAVRHLNKNTSLSAIQRGGGNMGLIGVARAGSFFAHHPDEDGLRVMAAHKSNLAEKQPSLQYVVVGWAIDENVGRVEWKGITEHDANSLATDNLSPHEKTRLEEAKEFLYEELKDAPMWAKQIYRDANDAGIARRTLESAKSHMRIRSEKVGTEGWMWSLPERKDPHRDVRDVHDVRDVQNDHRSDTAYIKEGRKGREDREDRKGRSVEVKVADFDDPLPPPNGNGSTLTAQDVAEILNRPRSGPRLNLPLYFNEEITMRTLTRSVLVAASIDPDEWRDYAAVVEEAVGDSGNHPIECECQGCL